MSANPHELLTSADVAAVLGVSASTVKRWVDEGELTAERTVGGHRRISRAALERLQQRIAHASSSGRAATQLVDLLLSSASAQQIVGRLLTLRADAGSMVALTQLLAEALEEIGDRWQSGQLTVIEEHLASERLARALARLVDWVPLADSAPRALLAVPPGEEHTLGLSLLEVVLREAGWETWWAGRRSPVAELVSMIEDPAQRVRMVALSASIVSHDRRSLARVAHTLGAACASSGAALLLGGQGAWPETVRHARLVRELAEADRIARLLADPKAGVPTL